MQLLNVQHELRFNSKAILYHVRLYLTVFLCLFFVYLLKIVFYFLHELKQRVVTSLDGIKPPVDSDVTEGVKTTRRVMSEIQAQSLFSTFP